MLYKFKRSQLISDVPIYIGGLSSKMTEIYDRRAAQSRRGASASAIFSGGQPLCPQWQNDRRCARTPWSASTRFRVE